MSEGDVSKAGDRIHRRILLREFETVVQAALADDPNMSSFAVTGIALEAQNKALRPRYTGVPQGARQMPTGSWTPDRPTVVELLARTWELRSRRWDPIDQVIAEPNPNWAAEFRARWPGIFDCEMSCSSGWADLIEAVTVWLEERGELLPFQQVKQKYAELRLYANHPREAFGFELTTAAEHVVSGHVCELCGAPGETVDGPYLLTLCHRHRRESQS